jgi:hypothetical protein
VELTYELILLNNKAVSFKIVLISKALTGRREIRPIIRHLSPTVFLTSVRFKSDNTGVVIIKTVNVRY